MIRSVLKVVREKVVGGVVTLAMALPLPMAVNAQGVREMGPSTPIKAQGGYGQSVFYQDPPMPLLPPSHAHTVYVKSPGSESGRWATAAEVQAASYQSGDSPRPTSLASDRKLRGAEAGLPAIDDNPRPWETAPKAPVVKVVADNEAAKPVRAAGVPPRPSQPRAAEPAIGAASVPVRQVANPAPPRNPVVLPSPKPAVPPPQVAAAPKLPVVNVVADKAIKPMRPPGVPPTLQEKVGEASQNYQQAVAEMERILNDLKASLSSPEPMPDFRSMSERERLLKFQRYLSILAAIGKASLEHGEAFDKQFASVHNAASEAARYYWEAETHFRTLALNAKFPETKAQRSRVGDWYAARAIRCDAQAKLLIPTDLQTERERVTEMVTSVTELRDWVEKDPNFFTDPVDMQSTVGQFINGFLRLNDLLGTWSAALTKDLTEKDLPAVENKAPAPPPARAAAITKTISW